MTIQECHYQFKLNFDRVDTHSNEDFNKAEIDWLLNEARMIFLKRRTNNQSNRKNKGFEASSKRRDDLSTLVIKYPLQPAIAPTLTETVYELNLADLAYEYYQLIALQGDVEFSENCVKKIPFKEIQHDDYVESLRDPFNSPSQEFIPYNFGRSTSGVTSSIYMYPDNYTINFVYPEYIKVPRKVSYGNYKYIDGNVYPPTDFDFPEHTHQEIVDIACEIASLNIENPEYISLKTAKTFSDE